MKESKEILKLFTDKELVKIGAPMVRYSKLQFRNLLRNYGCDLCYTPMILADSFCKSAKARNNEFTTNLVDGPLIVQFAANTVHDFVGASYMASPFCDGVDLNCGCPQRWAKQMGVGCIMADKPELIYDIIRQCRNRINRPFTVSVKMRLHKDLKKTVEICKNVEACGASFLTIHGRPPNQLAGDVNIGALKLAAENLSIPLVVNGGVKSLNDCLKLHQQTNCNGVMVANGLLTNPTLFTGLNKTPMECVQRWVNLCFNSTLNGDEKRAAKTIGEKPNNLTFQCFHHHLVFMLEKLLSKQQKRLFNNYQSFEQVFSFLEDTFQISPQLFDADEFDCYRTIDLNYDSRDCVYKELKPNFQNDPDSSAIDENYDSNASSGKYFESRIEESESCDWSNMFLENG